MMNDSAKSNDNITTAAPSLYFADLRSSTRKSSSYQDSHNTLLSSHNEQKKNTTTPADWRIPTILTLVFIFFVETSRLHPALSFTGKAWILVMSTYTFRNRRLVLLLKYLLAGLFLYTVAKFAVAALACRYDLGYVNQYLNMNLGKPMSSYYTTLSGENGQRGLSNMTSASRMQV